MTLEQVTVIIGKERLEEFHKFMSGQTVGINEDKSFDYYECDVENFLRPPGKRFFD
uniref:Uncharacterized protein n=1 Tax=viral metagenome TaxID=1070528 RepID=A0A6M3JVG2_9ZZZZ